MHLNDLKKMAFIMEWGFFVTVVMMFGQKTSPATFERIIMEIFGEYIPAFIKVFLDDFAFYSRKVEHLDHLRMCLENYRSA